MDGDDGGDDGAWGTSRYLQILANTCRYLQKMHIPGLKVQVPENKPFVAFLARAWCHNGKMVLLPGVQEVSSSQRNASFF